MISTPGIVPVASRQRSDTVAVLIGRTPGSREVNPHVHLVFIDRRRDADAELVPAILRDHLLARLPSSRRSTVLGTGGADCPAAGAP